MMNSNPETVSTDYDTSSRLYFEPLTVEDVLNVVDVERPDGIIVQFGGQTPLKLATSLHQYLTENPVAAASGEGNVRIWGTSPDAIDEAEDRDRWMALLSRLDIRQPAGGTARCGACARLQQSKSSCRCLVQRLCGRMVHLGASVPHGESGGCSVR
jgi:carbamoyl-phosphate synthase large subunit